MTGVLDVRFADVARDKIAQLTSELQAVVDEAAASAAAAQAAAAANIAWFIGGRPDADEAFYWTFAVAVDFPAAMAGSIAKAATAATGSTVFTLLKNGVSFGTLTFGTGQATGVFAAASGTSFAVGDVLSVVSPLSPDASLADIAIALLGTGA